MNITASPGRTWTILIDQRRLPSMAGAIATAFLHGGDRLARLAGVGGAASSAFFANSRSQGDPRVEPVAECAGNRHLGVPLDSVPVKDGSPSRPPTRVRTNNSHKELLMIRLPKSARNGTALFPSRSSHLNASRQLHHLHLDRSVLTLHLKCDCRVGRGSRERRRISMSQTETLVWRIRL
jgi:hypothetical protein